MVTELQKRCIEEASHEKLKNDAYAMLMNEEYYQSEIKRLEEENKNLNEYNRRLKQVNEDLKEQIKKLKEEKEFFYKSAKQFRVENEKLKATIKDHQLYEEKLEHRIIEFEELLH